MLKGERDVLAAILENTRVTAGDSNLSETGIFRHVRTAFGAADCPGAEIIADGNVERSGFVLLLFLTPRSEPFLFIPLHAAAGRTRSSLFSFATALQLNGRNCDRCDFLNRKHVLIVRKIVSVFRALR